MFAGRFEMSCIKEQFNLQNLGKFTCSLWFIVNLPAIFLECVTYANSSKSLRAGNR